MDNSVNANNICFKECIFKDESNLPVDQEIVIPDYLEPIKQMLFCNISSNITSKNTTGNCLNTDGITSFRLIYLDENDIINSFEGVFTFNKKYEFNFDFDDKKKIEISVSSNGLNCKILAPRRIEIKGNLSINLLVFEARAIEYIGSEASEKYETLLQKVPTYSNILFGEKNIMLEEEVSLSDSHAEIGRILCYEGRVLSEDCKVMNGKVMIKGVVVVDITYLSATDYSPCHFSQKIPYSHVCDLQGVDENFDCSTRERLVFLEVSARNIGDAELRSMIINAKINVCLEAVLKCEAEAVVDIYSIFSNTTADYSDIQCDNLVDKVRDVFQAKKSLKFSEGTFGSVININTNAAITNIKVEDNNVLVYGTINAKIIYCDISNRICGIERAIDFEYRYSMENYYENIRIGADINISNVSYILMSDSSIEILCELNVALDIFETTKCNIVTAVRTEENREESRDECSIMICYMDEPCDIWSVAKKYKSSVSNIRKLNGIGAETDKINGSVIIPVKQRN